MRLFDAHNHLQDDRLAPHRDAIIRETRAAGVQAMVVNGSCEKDWPLVARLAQENSGWVLPSFGYHPWSIHERTPEWKAVLQQQLESTPGGIGEIGLDRWKTGLDYAGQEPVFLEQLALAADRELPASIHCLQAWGRLLELLRQGPVPRPGFLLHSYGGPVEMIPALVKLGAYFSFPGYFMHERKARQRAAFQVVPADRLLIETDAPDQPLPEDRIRFRLEPVAGGRTPNHPANLAAVAEFLAGWLGQDLAILCSQLEENFCRLFGTLFKSHPPRIERVE